jgi:hypothetical protein
MTKTELLDKLEGMLTGGQVPSVRNGSTITVILEDSKLQVDITVRKKRTI